METGSHSTSPRVHEARPCRVLQRLLQDLLRSRHGCEPRQTETAGLARAYRDAGQHEATLECAGLSRAPTLAVTCRRSRCRHSSSTAPKTRPFRSTASSRSCGLRASQGCTLIEYEGAPHGLFATHKTRLTKDLLEFIGDYGCTTPCSAGNAVSSSLQPAEPPEPPIGHHADSRPQSRSACRGTGSATRTPASGPRPAWATVW